MNNLIQCEGCKNVIGANRIKVFDKVVKPGIEARVWKCPHCNHHHLVTVMDKTTRRMMNANKDDRDKIGSINRTAINQRQRGMLNETQAKNNLVRVEKLEKSIQDRTEKLDERMQGLIEEYKGAIQSR